MFNACGLSPSRSHVPTPTITFDTELRYNGATERYFIHCLTGHDHPFAKRFRDRQARRDTEADSSSGDNVDIYTDIIRNLSPAEKLLLVERIWDDLATAGMPLPLPEWSIREAQRRRDEMVADPKLGVSHEELWKRIEDARNG